MFPKYFKRGLISLERNLAKNQNGLFCNIQKKPFSSLNSIETIQTRIDKNSQIFQENYQNTVNQTSILNYHIMKILECGGKKTCDRHLSRGKLLVRDRIDAIIDKG